MTPSVLHMKTLVYRGLLALTLISFVSSCELVETNISPNAPAFGTLSPLEGLPGAQVNLAASYYNTFNFLGNLYTGGHVTAFGLQEGPNNRYQLTPLSFNGTWGVLYTSVLKELENIEVGFPADDNNSKHARAIAKILKAFTYQVIVDVWGKAPRNGALLGLEGLEPVYDSGEAIYAANIADLNEAVTLIGEAGTGTSSFISPFDVMFRGNMGRWRRFANTLILRHLIRQRDAVAGTDTQISDLIAASGTNGGFLTAGENVTVNPGYAFAANQQNPLQAAFRTSGGTAAQPDQFFRANQFSVDTLYSVGDRRVRLLYRAAPVPPSNYTTAWTTGGQSGRNRRGWSLGVVSGVVDSNSPNSTSRYGIGVYGRTGDVGGDAAGATRPAYLMLASESLFLQAEAALYGLGGTASSLYTSGIVESYSYLYGVASTAGLVSDGADGSYLQIAAVTPFQATTDGNAFAATVPLTGTEQEQLAQIIFQKYTSQVGINGFENWCEFRRTGFPGNLPLSGLAPQANYPIRVPYVQSEIAGNSVNVPTTDADYFTARVFWDTALETPTPAFTGLGR